MAWAVARADSLGALPLDSLTAEEVRFIQETRRRASTGGNPGGGSTLLGLVLGVGGLLVVAAYLFNRSFLQ